MQPNKLSNLIENLSNQGVNIRSVDRSKVLTSHEYRQLEFRQSWQTIERPSSVDVTDLMHLAVDTDDRVWFEQLASYRQLLQEVEERVRQSIGFINRT